MDRSDVMKLITVAPEQDELGRWVKRETDKEVFCRVGSVTQSEFYEAGRNGLNPQYKFTMFAGDYDNEPIVEYKDERYAVYRTYLRKDDDIEIYVERQGGTNG